MDFDLDYLEKLAQIIKENDLTEITLEDEDKTVSFRREKPKQEYIPVQNNMTATATSQIVAPVQHKPVEIQTDNSKKGKPLKAPMVGTFYSSPSPDSPPFVKVGDNISTGQIVCIIEAMKLMNEIESDVSGKIVEICVKNGENVEFGQTLMYVD